MLRIVAVNGWRRRRQPGPVSRGAARRLIGSGDGLHCLQVLLSRAQKWSEAARRAALLACLMILFRPEHSSLHCTRASPHASHPRELPLFVLSPCGRMCLASPCPCAISTHIVPVGTYYTLPLAARIYFPPVQCPPNRRPHPKILFLAPMCFPRGQTRATHLDGKKFGSEATT